MTKQSRLFSKLKKYWAGKLEYHPDAIDQLSMKGFFPTARPASPLELVAVSSFLIARRPIYEAIETIMMYIAECTSPAFNGDYFSQLEETIHEIELAGLRSHARDLCKLGRVVAMMQLASHWKDHWEHDANLRLKSVIRDEPFLPQRS
jgi:hypothetical protein